MPKNVLFNLYFKTIFFYTNHHINQMKTLNQITGLILFFSFLIINENIFAQITYAKISTTSIGGADGVAIWINYNDPSQSMVIGADPGKGLGTFNLDGSLIEVVNYGKGGAGEVDVRYHFPLGEREIPLIAGANNKENYLRIFTINPETRLLEEITGEKAHFKINAYGSCLYHSKKTGKFYSFITSREGLIEQWELFDDGHGKVNARLVREINIMPDTTVGLNPKTEACVADDELGWVYFSQEEECMIWRYGAEPEEGDKRLLVDVAKMKDGDNVEGLAIYNTGEGKGYLVASVQGSWKYKIYTRTDPYTLLGTFQVMKADSTGIVESHDCIEIANIDFGSLFPRGFMVTQNANNACGRHFQLVPWSNIAGLFGLNVKPEP